MNQLPLNLDQGDIVEIDGIEHVFDRIDPDGRITFTSLRQRVEFTVTDPATGFPVKPTADHIAELMIAGVFIQRAPLLDDHARQIARKMELDAQDARECDPVSEFRVAFLRRYDANPCGLSDRALRKLNQELLEDPEIAMLPGARVYAGSTLRSWIHDRGFHGDRRARDGISMKGRMPRKRKVKHPPEIIEHWTAYALGKRTTSSPDAKVTARKGWERYGTEINRINAGLPTGRDGPKYPQPSIPYKAVSYSTFWRICAKADSSAALGAKHGRKAVYSRFGGGGKTDQQSRVGALVMMDDTPIPGLFLVDAENNIPLGSPTLHLIVDNKSKVIPGWDLSWDEPSAATVLRTVLHANTPKRIPADLEKLHPDLKWICFKPSVLLVDNLTGHHSRHVEDSLLDVGTDVEFAGEEMPRDKAAVERVIGTILSLFVKNLPAATYDIPRAREFGFDPSKMVMCDIKIARELLNRAICTYHLTPHRGLKGRQPALVFRQHVAAHGVSLINDIDEFKRSIGNVEYDVALTSSGIELHGLRYSDARVTRVLVDDLLGHQTASEGRTAKKHSLRVKVKFSPDDIGEIHVWNTFTKRYVTLPAVDHEYAKGMPLWAHRRVLEFARHEALEYSSEAELLEIRSRLFEAIEAVSAHASEQDRKALAKLKDNPLFQRVMGDIVEVVDEELIQDQPGPLPDHAIPHELAAPGRQDATTRTPRPPRPPTSGRHSSRGGKAGNQAASPLTQPNKASSAARKGNSANLKWGDQYD